MPQIQIKKKGSSEFEAGGWIDIEGKAKEAKRKREISFSSFDAKTLVSTGSFVEWNEDKELGVSGSALVVVSFPPWQSSFPPDAHYLFLFLSGCRAT
jgi:hypothetical protein